MSDTDPETAKLRIGTDLVVDRPGYGAMQLTGNKVWGESPDRDGGIDLLRSIVDSGVAWGAWRGG